VPASSEIAVAQASATLPDDVDLHARPAARFVKVALGFAAKLTVSCGEREADAKSLLAVLALGARRGTRLGLRGEGEDAVAAVQELTATVAGLSE
jgi:phosphotransferase system HPr (HPr) family protein